MEKTLTPTQKKRLQRLGFDELPLAAVATAAHLARDSRAELDKLICAAHQRGYSTRAIAGAAGLSHQRISQILRGL